MTTLKGVFPDPKPARRRNFIHENVKNLRRMEQCFHTNKGMEELQNLQLQKHQKFGDKYQNVTARVNSSFREKKSEDNNAGSNLRKTSENQQQLCRKSSAPALNKDNSSTKTLSSCTSDNARIKQTRRERKSCNKSAEKLQGKILSDPNFSHKSMKNIENHSKAQSTKYKSQGIQTLDTKEMDDLYSQGMIRYPSRKCINQEDIENKLEMAQHTNDIPKGTINSPSDRGDIETPHSVERKSNTGSPELHTSKEEIDFIKLNKERTSAASRTTTQLNSSVPPANYRKGVVPKYIRERKEAFEREQKEKAEASHSDCPEGHVSLPDHERKETLRMLKKNYQEYVNELNKLPIKTDTLRAQRRKMEIEKQLNKLEEGIKVFSRPKVYVKVNA